MNSRRFIYPSVTKVYRVGAALGKSGEMSALGQKQTYAVQHAMSALPPNSDRESGHAAMVMSALTPKADMCGANRHVCFGPIADITDASIDIGR